MVYTTGIKVDIYYGKYILILSPILLQLQFSLSVYPPDHSSSQDALRPFPWPRVVLESPNPNEPENAETGSVSDRAGVSKTSSIVLARGRTDVDLRQLESCVEKSTASQGLKPSTPKVGFGGFCDALEFLHYKVPPSGATAGKVLQHAKSVISGLIQREQPMVFKIGYTHDAMWRWSNKTYGYQHDTFHKWSNMLILYESTEPFGPAMLEASLIEIFRSTVSSLRNFLNDFEPTRIKNLTMGIVWFHIDQVEHYFFDFTLWPSRPKQPVSQVSQVARTSELEATASWCHHPSP